MKAILFVLLIIFSSSSLASEEIKLDELLELVRAGGDYPRSRVIPHELRTIARASAEADALAAIKNNDLRYLLASGLENELPMLTPQEKILCLRSDNARRITGSGNICIDEQGELGDLQDKANLYAKSYNSVIHAARVEGGIPNCEP